MARRALVSSSRTAAERTFSSTPRLLRRPASAASSRARRSPSTPGKTVARERLPSTTSRPRKPRDRESGSLTRRREAAPSGAAFPFDGDRFWTEILSHLARALSIVPAAGDHTTAIETQEDEPLQGQ